MPLWVVPGQVATHHGVLMNIPSSIMAPVENVPAHYGFVFYAFSVLRLYINVPVLACGCVSLPHQLNLFAGQDLTFLPVMVAPTVSEPDFQCRT
jgi:hypothetical protein